MIGVSTNDKYPVLIIVDNFGQLFVVDYVTIEIVILYGTVLWYGTWYLVPAGTGIMAPYGIMVPAAAPAAGTMVLLVPPVLVVVVLYQYPLVPVLYYTHTTAGIIPLL